jgi:Fur family ferric uptake transcriptional regulator
MARIFTVDDLRDRLQARQHKMTPQRQMILQVFIERPGEHLSAEEVQGILRDNFDSFGMATVYRNIELLTDLELLQKIDLGDGKARYELNTKEPTSHNHHHLICIACGKISEFNDDLLDGLERSIFEKCGFEVTDHQVKFFGYCQECREAGYGAENDDAD